MKKTVSRLVSLIGAFTAIAVAALWATFWWRWVASEYALAPQGSKNLEHAIFNEIGGTVFVGFSVFWLFRRSVCAWRSVKPPAVSPISVLRYLAPPIAKVDPTSNTAIAYLWMMSAMKRTLTNAAYRLGRFIRRM